MPDKVRIEPVVFGSSRGDVPAEALAKAEAGSKKRWVGVTIDPLAPEERPEESLSKSILNYLNGPEDSVHRLAFEVDPARTNSYAGVYRQKFRLIPNDVLKRIAIQDDLVAAIVHARQNQMRTFGRPRPDRFSVGFVIEPDQGALEKEGVTEEQKREVKKRIEVATKRLANCGRTEGWAKKQKMTFSEWMSQSVRSALVVGRATTEIVRVVDPRSGEKVFHSFRVVDAGTIYEAVQQRTATESVRKEALHLLRQVAGDKGDKLVPEKFANDDYSWVQVVEGKPVQAFTDDELKVHDFYSVPDVEMDGYPVTPLDTVIAAVTTHVNITSHNRLYFQTGRAARGMLVIQSDDADETVVNRIRQQFNASINGVSSSWRMPCFLVDSKANVTWSPIDSSGNRDMEFQYLADMNARVILSAFQMSPEELPGWAYLSRGTNSQALCLHPDSCVITPEGRFSIGDLLDEEDERHLTVWTGTAWAPAKAFVTGDRDQARTSFGNGVTLVTSPDHQFRIITSCGEPGWKRQKDLVLGDYVLVNKRPVPGSASPPPFRGRALTEDMAEVLGWLTGDGCISLRHNKTTGNVKQGALVWFYHHEKEVDVWERHSRVLREWGLDAKQVRHEVTAKEAQSIRERKGVRNVASTRLRVHLYDTDFVRWLLDLGFTTSAEGKTIPAFLHALPENFRGRFLKGFFSADGTRSKSGAVRIVIHDNRLREQTKHLLLGLGIRTQGHEGLFKHDFGFGTRERVKIPAKTFLCVRDKTAFFERVGFIQAHKQPIPGQLERDRRWEHAAPETIKAVARRVLGAHQGLTYKERNNTTTLLNERAGRRASVPLLVGLLEKSGLSVPSWMTDYYFEPVTATENLPDVIKMVDLTVFDDQHAFVADGVVVHNSETNNQFQLEAHRDLGIRPLIAAFETFINADIFPLVDPVLAKFCVVKLVGLDADTPEKETVRLQQDSPVHMTYDEVLRKVEKPPVGKGYGGEFPLNPQWQAVVDKYVPVGQVMERFFGVKGAAKDPRYQYVRDPFYFQVLQMQMQAQQLQAQQQAQQQADAVAQAQQGAPGGPGEEGGGQEGGGGQERSQGQGERPGGQQKDQPGDGGDLTRAIDQAIGVLSKSEVNLPPSKRRLLGQHRAMVDFFMKGWEDDVREATRDIVGVAEKFAPGPGRRRGR